MENLDEDAIHIFTDGSSKPKPRRGGIGFLVVAVQQGGLEQRFEFSPPGFPAATNNQMELQACIEALKFLRGSRSRIDTGDYRKIVVHTDSMYIVENLDRATFGWPAQGWKKRTGQPVRNAKQWKELTGLRRNMGMRVDIRWVKGKSSESTKAADRLAKSSAERPLSLPLRGTSPRRKNTNQIAVAGSVPVHGQVEVVRIISADWEPLSRLTVYRYELVAGDLEGEADFASSREHLRSGHTFKVRFNEDPANPQFAEILGDLTEVQQAGTR